LFVRRFQSYTMRSAPEHSLKPGAARRT
jgi:hypothetical protein